MQSKEKRMKKNHEVRIKVTEEELEKLGRKADACGVPVSTFLRMVGLKSTITIE
jgi:predicted DNA binding CopG/RHH family protein